MEATNQSFFPRGSVATHLPSHLQPGLYAASEATCHLAINPTHFPLTLEQYLSFQLSYR